MRGFQLDDRRHQPQGGNMGRDAVMAAIARQSGKTPQAQRPTPESGPTQGLRQVLSDTIFNPRGRQDKREREARLAEGGRVRPRGFVSGPGTSTSDSIKARLSDGEYVLPADTVQAVGVDQLDALREATHTPARGNSKQRNGELFLAGGGFMPGVRAVFNSSGDEISNLARQGRYGAAAGETARAALAYVPAALDDVVGGAIRAVGPGVVDAGKQFLGLNGGAAPQPSAQSGNQTSVNGAPAGTNSPGAASLASAEEMQRRATAIRGGAQAPTGEAAQTQQMGAEIMPGIYRQGNSFGDSAQAAAWGANGSKNPNANDLLAADAIANRSAQQVRAMAAQPQQPMAAGFQPAQAPEVLHSGNSWGARNALRNAQVSASSMTEQPGYGGIITRRGVVGGRPNAGPASQQYAAMLAADAKARGQDAELQGQAMRENAATGREGMREQGLNTRNSADLAARAFEARYKRGLDERRLELDEKTKGFDIRNAQRKEGILRRYDAAKTDEERAALIKQFPDVFGKQDGSWKLQVTPATKNMDGSTSEGSVIRYNDRTGQVERVNLDGQQQSAPADKAQRKVGVTYMMPNGQLGRWTEKGWLPVA